MHAAPGRGRSRPARPSSRAERRVRRAALAVALAAWLAGAAVDRAIAQQTLVVHAAGSLRSALAELARAYERQTGTAVELKFGPSGLLKDRIAGGEPAQVFASANMTYPQALHAQGKAEAVRAFARNELGVLARGDFSLQGKPLAQRLLDADVRVGTSTPRADPSGDYAFQMFERIESSGAAGPGAAEALKAKAMQLTGGPDSPPPPAGRSVYGMLVAQGQADVFVTYCTNAAEARKEQPSLQVLPLPAAINVAASYGIAVVLPASAAASGFVDFVLGEGGQRILRGWGFSAP
ncbi:MAG: molybdate ABC transporter substrate-binding protein [Burkholderiales bacterium]|nr:molybdate ABC transporter substrate-binding protein [Burkholderiales bacterium]